MEFYFNKAVDRAPFSSDFSKASFVSRGLLLANVTLLYSVLAERERKCPWVLNMESCTKTLKGERSCCLPRLHLSLCVLKIMKFSRAIVQKVMVYKIMPPN